MGKPCAECFTWLFTTLWLGYCGPMLDVELTSTLRWSLTTLLSAVQTSGKGQLFFCIKCSRFSAETFISQHGTGCFGLVTQCYDNKRFASCLDPQIDYTLSGPIHKFFILRVENISSSIEAVPACVFFIQNNHFRKTSLPNLVTFNAVLKLNDWERAMHLFSVMQHLHPGESDHLWWEGKGWNILKLWSSFLLKMQDAHLKCFFWSRVHCNIYI